MILAKRKKIQTICENDGIAKFIFATFNKTDYDQQKFAQDFFQQWKIFTLKLETNELQAKYEKTIAILTKQLEQKDAEIIALKTTINNETEYTADLNEVITAVSKDQDKVINLLKANYYLTQQALLQFVAQKIAPNQFTLLQDNDSGIEVIAFDGELNSGQQSNYYSAGLNNDQSKSFSIDKREMQTAAWSDNESGEASDSDIEIIDFDDEHNSWRQSNYYSTDLNNDQSSIMSTLCAGNNYLSNDQSKSFNIKEWDILSSASDEDSDSDISIIYTNKPITKVIYTNKQNKKDAVDDNHSELIFC